MKVIVVAGARPNFMKVAPLMKEFAKNDFFTTVLVHTGQHYDKNMSDDFFTDLGISKPEYNLGVHGGSHAVQTASIMMKFEELCLKENPDLIVVVGDVNSTIACALTAKKMHIPVAHVESGLRSFDQEMPEEVNRVLTDHISDFLFVTEKVGMNNLDTEGIDQEKVFLVGNIMIDALVNNLKKIFANNKSHELGLKDEGYGVITLHRPKTVDDKEKLIEALDIIKEIQKTIPLVWPLHPRTKNNIEKFSLQESISSMKNLLIIEPLSYLDFMNIVSHAKFVMTDSGGIQQETTYLNIPCLTLRETTELPVTIDLGTNTLLGLKKELILKHVNMIQDGSYKKGRIPPLWDGKTAQRIVRVLQSSFSSKK